MSNFIGSFSFSVDDKGRLSIPAAIRAGLAGSADETFVVSRGLDGCLDAYPLDEWTRRIKVLRSLPNRRSGRYFRRQILGNATQCRMDSHNRILVSPELLRSAGIEESVLIIGQLDHLEFWNPSRYEAYVAAQETSLEDILEELESQMGRDSGP